MLAADAERLAKGWLLALIEQRPLSEAPAILRPEWAAAAPGVCAGLVRALGSDDELSRLMPDHAEPPGSLDALRAVVWSALRSACPDAAPDQVWDLGERLAVAIEALREGSPAWPQALEDAIVHAHGSGTTLAVVLAELVDYDRLLATESPEDCAAVISRFRDAIRVGLDDRGRGFDPGRAIADGEARVWAILPGADRARALAVGAAVADAVRAAPPWRGAPLVAAVGVAVLGEDGADAGALVDAAEVAMFSSAAGGPP